MKKYSIEILITGDTYNVEKYKQDCSTIEKNLLDDLKEKGIEDEFEISYKIQLSPLVSYFLTDPIQREEARKNKTYIIV